MLRLDVSSLGENPGDKKTIQNSLASGESLVPLSMVWPSKGNGHFTEGLGAGLYNHCISFVFLF